MTRIVKSAAVVDDRALPARPQEQEAPLVGMPIIKRTYLDMGIPQNQNQPRTQQSYQDELNRVRVEIGQAKAELRTIKRQTQESQEALEEAQAYFELEKRGGTPEEKNQALRDKAQEEVRQILEKARQQGEAIVREAQEQGYREGYSQGLEEAKEAFQAENQPKVEEIQAMLEALSSYSEKQFRQNQKELVGLVMAVAEKILHKELEADPQVVVEMLREVLESKKREDFVKITISKDLLPAEASASEEVIALLTKMGANVTVRVENNTSHNNCVVETPGGLIDMGVDTQLANIEEALIEA